MTRSEFSDDRSAAPERDGAEPGLGCASIPPIARQVETIDADDSR
jgi:hypothetical protein